MKASTRRQNAPLLDFQRYRAPEMTKHIRIHYQKEFRIPATRKKVEMDNLKPLLCKH